MAEWKESPEEYLVLVWLDVGEEEGEEEEEVQGTIETHAWIFRTEAEVRAFVIDQVLEKVKTNEDQLPPADVRQIRDAAARGDADEVIGMWIYLVEHLFEGHEFIKLTKSRIMTRS